MPAQLSLEYPAPDKLQLVLAGSWLLATGVPPVSDLERQLQASSTIRTISFDDTAIGDWDSALLTFLARVYRLAGAHHIDIDTDGLPDGARRMMALATAVPPKEDTGKHGGEQLMLARIGEMALAMWRAAPEMLPARRSSGAPTSYWS
jgi:phospholipid/cholesterol/gamma-HCH transport system permease protein